jgi:hypothetical protein
MKLTPINDVCSRSVQAFHWRNVGGAKSSESVPFARKLASSMQALPMTMSAITPIADIYGRNANVR